MRRKLGEKGKPFLLFNKEVKQENTTINPRITTLLEQYVDVFPEELPTGLPPIRGIEHQVDLMPRAALANKPAYRANSEETKELQRQI